ncbi:efflux RND transporter periplasmic adaptor subunit [Paludisphaera mucosa]|uniref:Efflux RND transporter periplasmic adaptor subunit n=1 Tax=Paludisphaera mucosa TaxID=3030827 RepID=A0ABT6F4L4_9BACT|nr:efflux RND transporter periplasmic adaptor subunit [Paludisphaera mucosa]MDG3002459.1 efflux RND transporter periplasmic adaptor subunit [Paludisphaera mucosa]
MPTPRKVRSSLGMIAIAAAAGAAIWAYASGHHPFGKGGPRNLDEKYQFAPVSRTVLEGSLTTPGRLESSKRTVIECELENITIGILGRQLAAGGASTLLSVVPDGTPVKAGDVLATLDSSAYEELLRQQRMTVERSRADHHQTELDLDVAKLAISEFQNGLMAETLKDHQRLIALAEAEASRSKGRLDWANRMNAKGYVSTSVRNTEKQTYGKAMIALERAQGARDLFERFTAAKTIRQLEGTLLSRQASLKYQDIRLQRNLDRLAKLEKQVELCTIRAPHDGYVIYANDPRRGIVIEAGISVRQKQDLFYLPDLEQMEVVALLHESVVDRVKRGMKARIAFDGAPDVNLTGRVRSVAPIPIFEERSDVRYFEGIVTIDQQARRALMPGMSARVDLAMPPKSNVLAVPVEAVTSEDGDDFCYVEREDGEGLEKRHIELGQATHDMLEVAEGLEEGERVVLNPRADEVADDVSDLPLPAPEPAPAAAPAAGPIAALR